MEKPGLLVARALLVASLGLPAVPSGATYMQNRPIDGTSTTVIWPHALKDIAPHEDVVVARISKQIQGFMSDPELLDEGEPPPSQNVAAELLGLIRGASHHMLIPMPTGRVSAFFGELNVVWRSGGDIVRLACFSNRPPIIQFGTISAPLGSYRSEPVATTESLARHLTALMTVESTQETEEG